MVGESQKRKNYRVSKCTIVANQDEWITFTRTHTHIDKYEAHIVRSLRLFIIRRGTRKPKVLNLVGCLALALASSTTARRMAHAHITIVSQNFTCGSICTCLCVCVLNRNQKKTAKRKRKKTHRDSTIIATKIRYISVCVRLYHISGFIYLMVSLMIAPWW